MNQIYQAVKKSCSNAAKKRKELIFSMPELAMEKKVRDLIITGLDMNKWSMANVYYDVFM